MITNEPVFESRDAADRFCSEVEQRAKLAEGEFGKTVALFSIINAIGFFIFVPVLILKVLAEVASAPGAPGFISFVVKHPMIVHLVGVLVGAVILEDNFFAKTFAKRAARLDQLDAVLDLKKPIGPYTLHVINHLTKITVQTGLPFFRINVSSDGKLQYPEVCLNHRSNFIYVSVFWIFSVRCPKSGEVVRQVTIVSCFIESRLG
jgi:hypothetical protein